MVSFGIWSGVVTKIDDRESTPRRKDVIAEDGNRDPSRRLQRERWERPALGDSYPSEVWLKA
jgi:hypothetical protein